MPRLLRVARPRGCGLGLIAKIYFAKFAPVIIIAIRKNIGPRKNPATRYDALCKSYIQYIAMNPVETVRILIIGASLSEPHTYRTAVQNPPYCERSEPVTRVGWRISLVYI